MWKRIAVLVVVSLLPISAVAHTKLFYRQSYRSDYWKAEVVTPEPTEIPIVKIPLESTLTPEPTPTPTLTSISTEVPTTTPSVEIIDTEDVVETTDQITTPSDVDDQVDIAPL